jgi:molecular chaperone DnaK (HSP70)
LARKRVFVGIDLGTTNSAVAYLHPPKRKRDLPEVHLFQVPQLTAPGTVTPRPVLPSFLYQPGEFDLSAEQRRLPWEDTAADTPLVGELARVEGSKVPARLVASAKSWLCHPGVDRTARILPWGAPPEVPKLSPVEVSARYLRHVLLAWNAAVKAGTLDADYLEKQPVVLTVPASFDEVARELTVEAARQAGLGGEGLHELVLLEEPQAAFYSWLVDHERTWQEQVKGGELLLVCDIGGGTTDFSLLRVREEESGELVLERTAVGEHLLLGGDNMDLALARVAEEKLTGGTALASGGSNVSGRGPLDAREWQALTLACRAAKEQLLGPPESAPPLVTLTLAGRGSRLIGGTTSVDLRGLEARQAVLEGFFPITALAEAPQRRARGGLQEWGLPYAADPAVSRHLAAFLRRHAPPYAAMAHPDRVLFNGGVLNSAALQKRIIDVLEAWQAEGAGSEESAPRPPAPTVLRSHSLDLAVARGAAYYGLVRQGRGVRIHGGSPRAYYIEIEAAAAASGSAASAAAARAADRFTALCLCPRGMVEGQETELGSADLHVVTNRPVRFRLWSSSTRAGEKAGQLVDLARSEEALTELPPIYTVLRTAAPGGTLSPGAAAGAERTLPVKLRALLTEIGTLKLWLEATGAVAGTSNDKWRLEFDLRGSTGPAPSPAAAAAGAEPGGVGAAASVAGAADTTATSGTDAALGEWQKRLDDASALIREVFSRKSNLPVPPAGLMKALEERLGAGRAAWPTPVLRALWETVREVKDGGQHSAEHEARWLNLAGFCLRPGFGYPLDDWRVKEAWRAFNTTLHNSSDIATRLEWWILWRRVSGGLRRTQQDEVYKRLLPYVVPEAVKKRAWRKPPPPQEVTAMWQTAASLERVGPGAKRLLGDALMPRLEKRKADFGYWVIGRLGARVPLYGPVENVIDPSVARGWAERLLAAPWSKPDDAAMALAQLCRRSGDRARDIDETLRQKVMARLSQVEGGARLVELIQAPVELDTREERFLFGDSLPSGLRLLPQAEPEPGGPTEPQVDAELVSDEV